MPPASKKDVLFTVFDLKSSNKNQLLEGLIKIVTHKMLVTNDRFHLFLANCAETRNNGHFENIFDTKVNVLDPKKIYDAINSAEVSVRNPVSLLTLLLFAIYSIKGAKKVQGCVNYQILYFTSLENSSDEPSDEKIRKIVKELNENMIYLYIIGPEVRLPLIISNRDDVIKNMEKILVDLSNRAHVMAKKIVQQTKRRSVLCDIRVGSNIVHFFRDSGGSQPWLVPLSIGNNLQIPTKTMKIFNEDTDVKLSTEICSNSYSNRPYALHEDVSIGIPLKHLKEGVLLHGKFVKIEAEDEDIFKFETERSFDVVAFTKSEFVSEAYIEGEGTFIVVAGDGNPELFSTLVKVLSKDDKCIIAQRIYNDNNFPRYFVLKPEPTAKPPRFVMTSLPYADDVEGEYLKITKPKKSKEKLNADVDFINFCESINVCSDKCILDIPLAPSMTYDWFSDNVVKETARRLCNERFEFTETEPFVFSRPQSNEYWDKLKENWPKNDDES